MTYDIELGPMLMTDKVKWLVDMYRKNEGKLRYIIISCAVVTIALVIKYAFYNMDAVIETAGVITFDEDVYTPFKLTNELITDVGRASIQFPVKDSPVNWKIQTLNLVQSSQFVVDYLTNAGFNCVHLRHFGVSYDIIVFKNVTMVNPAVLKESPEKLNVKEMSLDGTVNWKKRPVWLKIAYVNEALEKQEVVLTGDQAICFSHYVF